MLGECRFTHPVNWIGTNRVLFVDLVRANAFERTYELETALGMGTGFTIDFEDRQYLVTAKHLLPPGDPTPEVKVGNRHVRATIQLPLLEVEPTMADVAVGPLG